MSHTVEILYEFGATLFLWTVSSNSELYRKIWNGWTQSAALEFGNKQSVRRIGMYGIFNEMIYHLRSYKFAEDNNRSLPHFELRRNVGKIPIFRHFPSKITLCNIFATIQQSIPPKQVEIWCCYLQQLCRFLSGKQYLWRWY